MKKLVVFPSDPIRSYYQKGEIKARYFNPGNLFDEVHVISLCDDEIEEEKVQDIAGEARLKIHPVGIFPGPQKPWLFFSYRQKVLKLVGSVAPNASRGFDLRYGGYLAVYCARKLGIPSVVSLHTDYSRWHNLRILGRDYLWPLFFSLIDYPMERSIIKHADLISGVYKNALRHIERRRKGNMQIIYNKVYTDRYDLTRENRNERPAIISVGRHIKGKNPENIIRAVRDLPVTLVLIGSGELTPKMKRVAADLGISDKVRFIESVPNSEIHHYYLQSDIFALSTQYPELAIPVIEAMAAALPIVLARQLWQPEFVADVALVVENRPEAFEEAFKRLIANSQLRRELGDKARKKAEEIDGEIMEKKEVKLYRQLIDMV